MTALFAARLHRNLGLFSNFRAASARSTILTLPLWALLTPSPRRPRRAGSGNSAVCCGSSQLEGCGTKPTLDFSVLLTQQKFSVAAQAMFRCSALIPKQPFIGIAAAYIDHVLSLLAVWSFDNQEEFVSSYVRPFHRKATAIKPRDQRPSLCASTWVENWQCCRFRARTPLAP